MNPQNNSQAFDKNLKQVFCTCAFAIAYIGAILTPAMFTSGVFAEEFYSMSDSLSVDMSSTDSSTAGYFLAQVGNVLIPPASANSTGESLRPTLAPRVDKPEIARVLPPAEVVKILVKAGIIPAEKADQAIEVLRKAMITQASEKIGDRVEKKIENRIKNERACFNFYRQLKEGDKGEDVQALNAALKAEGLSAPEGDVFTNETSSSVTGLQEKYKSEILKPAGLERGTGIVGKGTMAKLNRMKGCENINEQTQPERIKMMQVRPNSSAGKAGTSKELKTNTPQDE